MLTLTLTLTRKAAIDADPAVPLILVQELDKGRGGASLEELQAECPDDLRGDVFFGQESTCPLRTMHVHAMHLHLHMHTSSVRAHSPLDGACKVPSRLDPAATPCPSRRARWCRGCGRGACATCPS